MRKLRSCEKCSKLHRNPKYCSRSCAVSINNIASPKRTKTVKRNCKYCGEFLGSGCCGSRVCEDCNKNCVDWSTITLSEFRMKYDTLGFHARLRDLARRSYKSAGLPRKCFVCGYDKHIQVCHVVGVSQFPSTASITEVNNIANLVALCPNHHWEYDKGLFTLLGPMV